MDHSALPPRISDWCQHYPPVFAAIACIFAIGAGGMPQAAKVTRWLREVPGDQLPQPPVGEWHACYEQEALQLFEGLLTSDLPTATDADVEVVTMALRLMSGEVEAEDDEAAAILFRMAKWQCKRRSQPPSSSEDDGELPHVPTPFWFHVMVDLPCQLEHGEPFFSLWAKAKGGDLDAVTKLAALDERVVQHPAIVPLLHARGATRLGEVLAAAAKVRKQRMRSAASLKAFYIAQIKRMAEAMEVSCSVASLQRLFHAVAKDCDCERTGDPDLLALTDQALANQVRRFQAIEFYTNDEHRPV